jgi:uncharacterized protein (DUF3084 family)
LGTPLSVAAEYVPNRVALCVSVVLGAAISAPILTVLFLACRPFAMTVYALRRFLDHFISQLGCNFLNA